MLSAPSTRLIRRPWRHARPANRTPKHIRRTHPIIRHRIRPIIRDRVSTSIGTIVRHHSIRHSAVNHSVIRYHHIRNAAVCTYLNSIASSIRCYRIALTVCCTAIDASVWRFVLRKLAATACSNAQSENDVFHVTLPKYALPTQGVAV